MTQTIPPPTDDTSPASEPRDRTGLAGLRKMSTTAGVGLQDYQAVNALAVASLVCGVAAWMSWLHPLLYAVPVLAVLLGLAGLWQIRRSHGTQGGTVLALTGVLLGALIGGWSLAADLREQRAEQVYRGEIQQTIEAFGEALADEQYEQAYALMSDGFQEEFTLDEFRSQMAVLPTLRDTSGRLLMGSPTRAYSNEMAAIDVDPATGRVTAQALFVVEFERSDPVRQIVRMVRTDEGWRIQEFSSWFPRKGRRPIE